jgi:predicted dehydrogenase
MIRLAIIGAGSAGREHRARVERSARCRVAAVVDPLPQPPPWFQDASALPPVDAAIIATPSHLHVSAALPFLRSGMPVLIEKPLAHSLTEAGQLLPFPRQVLAGYHRRHSATIQTAQKFLAGGGLGRIVTVHATTLFHKPSAYFEVPWRTGPGGGPILINLAHDIDTLRALLGEFEILHATSTRAHRNLPVEDTAAVVIQFAAGALGTMLLSDCAVAPWSWEQTSGENPMYARDAAQDQLRISGTAGSLALPSFRWWRQPPGAASWSEPFEQGQISIRRADPLERQLDHFCDVIEGRALPLVTAEDGLRSLALTLEVLAAANKTD